MLMNLNRFTFPDMKLVFAHGNTMFTFTPSFNIRCFSSEKNEGSKKLPHPTKNNNLELKINLVTKIISTLVTNVNKIKISKS